MPKKSKPKTIIFIHGLRGDHHGLAAIAKKLQELNPDYRILSPDLPGYGERPALEPQNLDAYADWLADYVRRQCGDKAHPVIIGHSMGSIIASHFVAKYPKLCAKRQVLLSPVFRTWHGQIRSNICNHLITLGLYLLPPKARFRFMKSDFISLRVSHFLTYDRSQRQYIDEQHLKYSGNFTSAKNLIVDIRISMREQTIITPSKNTLVCIGECDKLTSNRYAHKICRQHNAKFVEIPQTGHLVNYENPTALAQEISRYLTE